MREIKFRGWDSENKKWRYGHFFETVEGIMRCYNIVENREVRFYCSPQSIGQFTGLKDKNGKEIYMGDIVTFYDFKRDDDYLNRGIILSEDETGDRIGVNISNRHSVEMNEIDFNIDVEVIGNIYENHELIEQQ